MNTAESAIARDLRPLLAGQVSGAPPLLDEMSYDFGRIVERRPGVVVRPATTEDVALVTRYAGARGIPVSARASGHTFGGQSLNEGGILIDMRGLADVHRVNEGVNGDDGAWFEAGAGATWFDVVGTTWRSGLLPPVLTTYLRATVGGTHSVGGFGTSSFKHGTHTDNCIEIEIVTGEGEVVRCSSEQNADLFHHALASFGTLGIITRIKHRLRRPAPLTRTYFLRYDDLGPLLADQARLIEEQRIDYLDSRISPYFLGFRTINGGKASLLGYAYPLNITVETGDPGALRDEEILGGLSFARRVYTEDLPTFSFLVEGRGAVRSAGPRVANPWQDHILPWSKAQSFIESALPHIPLGHANLDMMLLWPALRAKVRAPMLRVPEEPLIMGFGVYRTISKTQLPEVMPVYRALLDRTLAVGGKPYLCGPLRLDEERKRAYWGDYLPAFEERKRRYDPKGILNPSFFKPGDGGT